MGPGAPGEMWVVGAPGYEENLAVLSVTPSWNPGGGGGTYVDHPVGVLYDPEEERWAILNHDLAPMPEGAAYNVSLSE